MLARQAQAGDLEARHELRVELHGSVRRPIDRVLGSGRIPDDVVQEPAELHARFKKFDEPARSGATLTTGSVEP